ncbi:MAG TPA: T9SS type A sorting domain-containing protein, partial [Bacteroidales bacterium]|nr:T9SS type A sorting domain-containing protein [Bacteroidales bacterium]
NPSGTATFPYPQVYNNLLLSGSGTKLMADMDIQVNGVLTNASGSIFTASPVGVLSLDGNWVSNGTFNHNMGTIRFNGNTTISGTSPPIMCNAIINASCALTAPVTATVGFAGNLENNGTFNHNSGTVSFNGNSLLSGTSMTTFNNVLIMPNSTFTGKQEADFTVLGNWTNNGNFLHNDGGVIFDGVSQISGATGTRFGNVTINSNRYLTGPNADTMFVAINFMNNGYFNNNAGTIAFNGTLQEIAGSSATLYENMVVEEGSLTNITAENQTLRGVLRSDGTLAANRRLTLLSNQSQTALVDGAGTGEVTGNLVVQRYLPVGFGYKYFSSPFQGATVGQFSDFMRPNPAYPTFPAFYRYDENRFFTGWVNYSVTSGVLDPMEGYAVNFGPLSDPITVSIYGVVNNRNMIPLTLFNNDRPFTKGFNLLGNPYPSPIDWDAGTGWIRTNIDNALYYFDAGTTDPYTGTYSTYVDGVSSNGKADNIIAAMQGFFTHVTDGNYPVASTLIFTNGTRVNNLSPAFHKKHSESWRPLLRIRARNAVEGSSGDPLVICFNPEASPLFDREYDALKLMNTDVLEPNFYTVSPDSNLLSICSIPEPTDSLTEIPLGIRTAQDGLTSFRVMNLDMMPSGLYVYFCDRETGVRQNVALHPEYQAVLAPGCYNHRFSVLFSRGDLRRQPGQGEAFMIYSFRNRLFVYSTLETGQTAELTLFNLLGQRMMQRTLSVNGYLETDLEYPAGLYIANIRCGETVLTRKLYLTNQW